MDFARSQIIETAPYAIRIEEFLSGRAGRGGLITPINAELVIGANPIRFARYGTQYQRLVFWKTGGKCVHGLAHVPTPDAGGHCVVFYKLNLFGRKHCHPAFAVFA